MDTGLAWCGGGSAKPRACGALPPQSPSAPPRLSTLAASRSWNSSVSGSVGEGLASDSTSFAGALLLGARGARLRHSGGQTDRLVTRGPAGDWKVAVTSTAVALGGAAQPPRRNRCTFTTEGVLRPPRTVASVSACGYAKMCGGAATATCTSSTPLASPPLCVTPPRRRRRISIWWWMLLPPALIFALANPTPEILPEEVKAVRSDAIMATGRTDYPNQVNNVLCFPFIFRGALDAGATTINEAMKSAAAQALASLAREDVPDDVVAAYQGNRPRFGPQYIIPVPFDPRLIQVVPMAVAKAAMETGVAGKPIVDMNAYKAQLPARRAPVAGTLNRIFEGLGEKEEEPAGRFEAVTVTPSPGFVVKTRRLLGNKDKVFINVFHHSSVLVEPPAQLARTSSNGTLSSGGGGDNRPFLVTCEPTAMLDKDGHNTPVYHVCVSSEYFRQGDGAPDLKITSPQSIQKLIHKVNVKFNDFLDEGSYVLPRSNSGWKGEGALPSFSVLVPVKAPPPSPSSASSSAPPLPAARSSFLLPSPRGSALVGIAEEAAEENSGEAGSVVSELTLDNPPPSPHPAVPRPASQRSMESRGSFTAAGAGDAWETGSATSSSAAPSRKRVQRKSVFDTSGLGINEGTIAGRNLLSVDMLAYNKAESVDNQQAEQLRKAAVDNPSLLLGWQIFLTDMQQKTEIYVVTGVRKNYLSKTEFRVSRFGVDDAWVRLKRGDKSGLDFRPLRKVLFSLANDDDDASVS
eukprot:gene34738-42065_t